LDSYVDPASVEILYALFYLDDSGNQIETGLRTTNLEPGESIEDYFILDNSSMKLGNYALKGVAYVLSSEAYDENFTNNELGIPGFEAVWLLGDVNNDRVVELMDFYYASAAYGSQLGHPRWDIRCDLWGYDGAATSPTYAGDGTVELMDFYCLSAQYLTNLGS
jgi:hypothetical protein